MPYYMLRHSSKKKYFCSRLKVVRMFEFTIIVPVYNEAENLERVEHALAAYLKVAIKKTQVLFVNDGSTDSSGAYLKEICSRNEAFHFIEFTKNSGLSAAIRAGFDTVETQWLGYMDSDLQTAPEDFNLLLAHTQNYDLITGVRSDRKDSYIKNISSKIANSIRRAFTKDGMDDTGCPLKVIKTTYAKNIPMFRGLHRFLPAMVLLQDGKILQVPVRHFPRTAGTAKFGVWNRLLGPLVDCFAYLWMKRKYIRYEIKDKG